MAQRTKVNTCQKNITQLDIFSLVMQMYRVLVPAIGLMYILQLGTLNESAFLLVLGLAPFGPYHCLYPCGHALNQISTNLLWNSLSFHLHPLPKLKHTSRRTSYALSCYFGCCHRCSIGLRSGDCAGHFKSLVLFCLNHFEAF